ncbi:MAG: MFS transporter, partial [Candidatus Puniceispirillaceae bacterium]
MTSSFTSRWYLVLLASAFLVIITLGVRQSFGLFLLPATEAMGTGREVFSLAMAMQNLVWGLVSPLAGAMADKFGAAKVAATGAICYAIGLFAMGAYISPEGLFFGQIMIGIGLGSAGMSIALGAVARATSAQKRSLALGLVVSIGSFGQFAVLPVTQFFINGFGWQMALILLSGVAASMLAACLVLHFKEDRPSGSTADLARLSAKDALTTALGSRDYILLTTGFFVCGIQIVFIGTHLPTYLRDAGLSAEVASWSLAVVGLFNIIGSFAAGWLGSFMS